MDSVVDLECVPARTMAAVRFHATPADIGEKIGEAFGVVAAYLGRNGIEPAGAAVARYEMAGDGFDVTAGFLVTTPVAGDGTVVGCELPAAEVAHVTHFGGYDDLPAAYAAIHAGAAALGRQVDDGAPMWEEYWSPPDTPPAETRTEIYWPLATA